MNFKVRCIKPLIGYTTKGKIYDVINGKIQYDNGRCSVDNYYSIEEMNKGYESQFELVEEEKMKYKAGDRVLVRSDLEVGKGYGDVGVKCLFPTWLDGTQGKIATITAAGNTSCGEARYITDLGSYYCNEMFERKIEEEKMFCKDDLKDGYVVELRNGEFLMVLEMECGKKVITKDTLGHSELNSYGDDLTRKGYERLDIIRVYGYSRLGYCARKLTGEDRKLLWERKPEIKEVTMQEIANWKGCSVETLRVKK